MRACRVFQQLAHENKIKVARENGPCMNCFGKGHVAKRYTMKSMYTKCNGHHHTLLHLDESEASTPYLKTATTPPSQTPESRSMCTHMSIKGTPTAVLLVTCQINVMGPDSRVMNARALTDPGFCCSFMSDHLHVVQHLRLPQRGSAMKIIGIGEISCESSRGTAQFHITRIKEWGIILPLEATILQKITSNLPCSHIAYNTNGDI